MIWDLQAYVTAALFESDGEAVFALGDGSVRWQGGQMRQAHQGPVLSAVLHPTNPGIITGGDDGRLVWSRKDGDELLAEAKGRWIDCLAAADTGLVAFGAGREARVLDLTDPKFSRTFTHERSVADLAFDPKGRRLAAATYGGAALWYARVADQQPVMLRWAGSHVAARFNLDGRFLVTAMQENALHGWRISDAKDLRMDGYTSKPRSMVFLDAGKLLATSGANGVVIWPFTGPDGPLGKGAMEAGFDESAVVMQVASDGKSAVLAAGLDDGRIWASDVRQGVRKELKSERGAAITALAVSHGKVAWGDEEGAAGVLDVPPLQREFDE